jgi:hypothetical protein
MLRKGNTMADEATLYQTRSHSDLDCHTKYNAWCFHDRRLESGTLSLMKAVLALQQFRRKNENIT